VIPWVRPKPGPVAYDRGCSVTRRADPRPIETIDFVNDIGSPPLSCWRWP